mmetsp:Transcript_25369/g.58992  ORF Transcript_25369/g.58992 Transcript_25369/m.58992 type:complete len:447 (-) Transcript_25369:93-1433(-)
MSAALLGGSVGDLVRVAQGLCEIVSRFEEKPRAVQRLANHTSCIKQCLDMLGNADGRREENPVFQAIKMQLQVAEELLAPYLAAANNSRKDSRPLADRLWLHVDSDDEEPELRPSTLSILRGNAGALASEGAESLAGALGPTLSRCLGLPEDKLDAIQKVADALDEKVPLLQLAVSTGQSSMADVANPDSAEAKREYNKGRTRSFGSMSEGVSPEEEPKRKAPRPLTGAENAELRFRAPLPVGVLRWKIELISDSDSDVGSSSVVVREVEEMRLRCPGESHRRQFGRFDAVDWLPQELMHKQVIGDRRRLQDVLSRHIFDLELAQTYGACNAGLDSLNAATLTLSAVGRASLASSSLGSQTLPLRPDASDASDAVGGCEVPCVVGLLTPQVDGVHLQRNGGWEAVSRGVTCTITDGMLIGLKRLPCNNEEDNVRRWWLAVRFRQPM